MAANRRAGVDPRRHAATIGGRFGGERMDRFALDNYIYALFEASGLDPEVRRRRAPPPSPN